MSMFYSKGAIPADFEVQTNVAERSWTGFAGCIMGFICLVVLLECVWIAKHLFSCPWRKQWWAVNLLRWWENQTNYFLCLNLCSCWPDQGHGWSNVRCCNGYAARSQSCIQGRVGIAGDCSAPVGPSKCGSRVTWHYLSQQDRLSIIILIFYYLSLVFILSVNVEINSFNSNL